MGSQYNHILRVLSKNQNQPAWPAIFKILKIGFFRSFHQKTHQPHAYILFNNIEFGFRIILRIMEIKKGGMGMWQVQIEIHRILENNNGVTVQLYNHILRVLSKS